jgi:hypothetical protein
VHRCAARARVGPRPSEFFKSALFVWFAGALIAFHQYWSSLFRDAATGSPRGIAQRFERFLVEANPSFPVDYDLLDRMRSIDPGGAALTICSNPQDRRRT